MATQREISVEAAWPGVEAALPGWDLSLRMVDGLWNAIAVQRDQSDFYTRTIQTYDADPVAALRALVSQKGS